MEVTLFFLPKKQVAKGAIFKKVLHDELFNDAELKYLSRQYPEIKLLSGILYRRGFGFITA